jgi:arginine deiminase
MAVRAGERALPAEIGTLWTSCGIDNEYTRLRTVLLHRPGAELAASADDFNAVQTLAPLDLGLAQAQYDAMAQAYRDHGVAVVDLRTRARRRPIRCSWPMSSS